MQLSNSFEKIIPKITDKNFKSCALDLFYHQASHNGIYKKYIEQLGRDIQAIDRLEEIPFLPIEFFKSHEVKTGTWIEQHTFLSSGTTKQHRSKHLVQDLKFYQGLSKDTFETFFGPLNNMVLLALLPSYLEQGNSSLIAMVDYFMSATGDPSSGYVTQENVSSQVQASLSSTKQVVLIGVSYALLDCPPMTFAGSDELIVIETGGMKGRKREMVREELHHQLMARFNTTSIHSEYGMTELFSQAYSFGNGQYQCPPWMSVQLRDMNDPFDVVEEGKTGGLM